MKYDDGEEEEVSLPEPSCRLLPKEKSDADADANAEGDEVDGVMSERAAYIAAAEAAEAEAKATVEAEGLKLSTTTKTDTGYRCVIGHWLSRLDVWSYEVRAYRDGDNIYLGRYPSMTQAAVVFARYELGRADEASAMNSADVAQFGNMVMPAPMPESMEGGASCYCAVVVLLLSRCRAAVMLMLLV